MKKSHMSKKHLKNKHMSKKATLPKNLKPTEKVGRYCFFSYIMRKILCETEKKLMQIHVGKFFFTHYIIKLQNAFVQVAAEAKYYAKFQKDLNIHLMMKKLQ